MKEKLEQRLADLREELNKGNDLLHRLQQQQSDLQEQMIRISGAIQVLEELLAAEDYPADLSVLNEAEVVGDP